MGKHTTSKDVIMLGKKVVRKQSYSRVWNKEIENAIEQTKAYNTGQFPI